MKILSVEILEAGPGVELSNLPDGVSVRMSDPVKDFKLDARRRRSPHQITAAAYFVRGKQKTEDGGRKRWFK